MTTWLGIDIGGANIKLAGTNGYARSIGFELWRHQEDLLDSLRSCIAEAPECKAIAATMTGELADCYATKREGVIHISNCLHRAAASRPLVIYSVDGIFRSVDETIADPLPAAASNWHALGTYAARHVDQGHGFLIDIGSTTCDLIPIANGLIVTDSRTDLDRLLAGELVYVGMSRTPICAITPTLPYRGQNVAVAAELFATTADVYTLLGWKPNDSHSADGRDFSKQCCIDRLARQICVDRESFSLDDAMSACRFLHDALLHRLKSSFEAVIKNHGIKPNQVVVSGSGEQLACSLATEFPLLSCVIRLSDLLSKQQSDCAAAFSVASLASEQSKHE